MGELESSLTQREFMEWLAFYKLNPFGLRHDDARLAVLTTVVANMLKSKGDTITEPWQLMPWIPKPEKAKDPATPEEISNAILNTFFPAARALNGPQPVILE